MNRTLVLNEDERSQLQARVSNCVGPQDVNSITDSVICADLFQCIEYLPNQFVDLLVIDPPYNLNKSFNGSTFRKMTPKAYEEWVDRWMRRLVRLLKPDASVYVCCDWQSSFAVYQALENHFIVKNRITWEREKGRGSLTNWKNCSEDIWYAVTEKDVPFHADRVMTKRKVLAPYRHENGKPKDWSEDSDGNYRMTHPSNLWNDITVPFWSMPENTDHPTQKPEKLIAKLILASSNPGDFVFDPFLGSGTTAVVAKKLGRRFCGVEIDADYCLLAAKRLQMASRDSDIQGFDGSVFFGSEIVWRNRRRSRRLRNCVEM